MEHKNTECCVLLMQMLAILLIYLNMRRVLLCCRCIYVCLELFSYCKNFKKEGNHVEISFAGAVIYATIMHSLENNILSYVFDESCSKIVNSAIYILIFRNIYSSFKAQW
jgi:hypothetical protein